MAMDDSQCRFLIQVVKVERVERVERPKCQLRFGMDMAKQREIRAETECQAKRAWLSVRVSGACLGQILLGIKWVAPTADDDGLARRAY